MESKKKKQINIIGFFSFFSHPARIESGSGAGLVIVRFSEKQ